MTDFLDQVDEQAAYADIPKVFRNFGQLNITVARYIHWEEGMPSEVDADTFAKLPNKERKIEILFSVNIQEFKPDLEFTYERRLSPGDEDWKKTLKPSLVALLGEASMKGGVYSGTLRGIIGKYVEIEDVPQLKKGVPDEDFNTIKFVQIFSDRNACFAAFEQHQAQFTEGGTVTESVAPAPAVATLAPATQTAAQVVPPANVPDGWEAPAWAQALPDVLARLDEGQTPAEVAGAYGVEERYVLQANANR